MQGYHQPSLKHVKVKHLNDFCTDRAPVTCFNRFDATLVTTCILSFLANILVITLYLWRKFPTSDDKREREGKEERL